jgi:branched-chain amino acid transport system substrate-binding protein
MTNPKKPELDADHSADRRTFVRIGGAGLGAALGAKWISAAAAPSGRALKIGFISPLSGPLAEFGVSDPFVLDLVRTRLAQGLATASGRVPAQLVSRDSQSNPDRATQMAQQLINDEHVDLMLTTSTPEVVNPVADACEAAGVPCIGTVDPWESWYYGRGAKPGQPSPFKWSYLFSFGAEQFFKVFQQAWNLIPTNRRVGVLYPNDADGNAFRANLIRRLEGIGFHVTDVGAYQDGTTDFSNQIAMLRKANVEIITGSPIPNDFAVFLRQAAQQGLTQQLKILFPVKVGDDPAYIESLGELGDRFCTTAVWSPAFPYVSPLLGINSAQLANEFEHKTGRFWDQTLGTTAALFDVAMALVRACDNPFERATVARSLAKLRAQTMIGSIDFAHGPVPNVATAPLVGCQWRKAKPGSRFKLAFPTIEHACDPQVPIQAKLVPYA